MDELRSGTDWIHVGVQVERLLDDFSDMWAPATVVELKGDLATVHYDDGGDEVAVPLDELRMRLPEQEPAPAFEPECTSRRLSAAAAVDADAARQTEDRLVLAEPQSVQKEAKKAAKSSLISAIHELKSRAFRLADNVGSLRSGHGSCLSRLQSATVQVLSSARALQPAAQHLTQVAEQIMRSALGVERRLQTPEFHDFSREPDDNGVLAVGSPSRSLRRRPNSGAATEDVDYVSFNRENIAAMSKKSQESRAKKSSRSSRSQGVSRGSRSSAMLLDMQEEPEPSKSQSLRSFASGTGFSYSDKHRASSTGVTRRSSALPPISSKVAQLPRIDPKKDASALDLGLGRQRLGAVF